MLLQLHSLASPRHRHLLALGQQTARRRSYHWAVSSPNSSWTSAWMMKVCWTTPMSTAQSQRQCRSQDVRMRVDTPPTSSQILGQQLHEVALRAARCPGLPLPPPPSVRSLLLDGEFYAGPAAPVPSCIPFFEEVHEELQATWATHYSCRAPRCRGSRPTCNFTGLVRAATSPSLRWRMQ